MKFLPIRSQSHIEYSRKIIEQSLRSGEPVVFLEGESTRATDSLIFTGARSALCVPLKVRGDVVGGMYLVHHQVGSLFGEVERRLSQFLVRIAGVAMENAEGFSELKKVNLKLSQEVIERKRAESKLEEYAQELARSNTELERFAYVSSHDLKEPLRTVASFLKLLEKRYKGALDQNADEYIHFAVDGVQRMSAMIDGLLEYSRLGKGRTEYRNVNLQEAFERATTSLHTVIKESCAVIENDKLPVIKGNAVQMLQLFQNLLGNAIKFRAQRTPRIEVRVREEKGKWLISVQDNGVGFESQDPSSVFVLFQRLHSKAQYPGSGIGLAVCKRIVETHGGQIWAESKPDVGSTFSFTLPKTADSESTS